MGTVYSAWCSRAWKPKNSSATRQYRARIDYNVLAYDTYYQLYCVLYLNLDRSVTHNGYGWYASNGGSGSVNSVFESDKTIYCYAWYTGTVARGHGWTSIGASGSVWASSSGGSNTWNGEWVTAYVSESVPPLDSWTVTYHSNDENNNTKTQTKWRSENLSVASNTWTRSGYKFLRWNTRADGNGTNYSPGQAYGVEGIGHLYAIWEKNPTCNQSVSSSIPYYTGKASYSVDISNIVTDSKASSYTISLTLGSTTVSRTSAGSLSITPSVAGTFTPSITIKDNLGASTTYTLSSITIKQYVSPSVSFTIERALNNGTRDETNGTACVITAKFTFCNDFYVLQSPTVNYNVTWYTSRNNDGKVSNEINSNDWSSIEKNQIIYGLITGPFSPELTYNISITPQDDRSSGTTAMQSLPLPVFPIDIFAGGKGVAFGRIATSNGLVSTMDATFEGDIKLLLDDYTSGGIDANLKTAISSKAVDTDGALNGDTVNLKILLTNIINKL